MYVPLAVLEPAPAKMFLAATVKVVPETLAVGDANTKVPAAITGSLVIAATHCAPVATLFVTEQETEDEVVHVHVPDSTVPPADDTDPRKLQSPPVLQCISSMVFEPVPSCVCITNPVPSIPLREGQPSLTVQTSKAVIPPVVAFASSKPDVALDVLAAVRLPIPTAATGFGYSIRKSFVRRNTSALSDEAVLSIERVYTARSRLEDRVDVHVWSYVLPL